MRLFALLVLLSLIVPATFLPSSAYASHGMLGAGPECGTHTFNADLTKGRTNSIVVHVVHTEGCRTYDYTNYVGADRARQLTADEDAWQGRTCQEDGVQATTNLFRYYWDQELTHDVKVSCRRYAGPD